MRDFEFKAGGDIHVGGDVHISDQSQRYKLLGECTNEELYEERQLRETYIASEKKDKLKRLAVAALVAAGGLSGGAIWAFMEGHTELMKLLLPLAALLIAGAGVKVWEQPTMRQARCQADLEEIDYLLRLRGAK